MDNTVWWGIITAAGVIFIVMKLELTTLRRILAFDIYVDIAVTLALIWLLRNTISGLQMAILSGVILSLVLLVTKYLIGYEKRENIKCPHCGNSKGRWVQLKFPNRRNQIGRS